VLGERDEQMRKHLPAANHHNFEGVTMTDEKLAQLDRLSQLLIFQLKTVREHVDQAWFELELARSDLRDLMETHEEWEEESQFKKGGVLY
jgi:hypothetical protein